MFIRGRDYSQEYISKSTLNSSPSKVMFSFSREKRFQKTNNEKY